MSTDHRRMHTKKTTSHIRVQTFLRAPLLQGSTLFRAAFDRKDTEAQIYRTKAPFGGDFRLGLTTKPR